MTYSKILSWNVKALYDRVWVYNKASLIVIDGQIGEGKTTLAVKIADEVNGFHNLPPIEFEKQLALGGEDFARKLQVCYKEGLPVLIYDEAGDFNKRGALTRLNALLTRTFETFRAFRVLVILCLPSFLRLDSGLMEKGIPRLLLRCSGRTLNQGNFRAWKHEQMKWLLWHSTNKRPQDIYSKVYPLFYGHFQNLEPGRAKSLDAYSVKGKIKALADAEIGFKGLVSYSDLAKKLNKSLGWVNAALKELKIKPVKKYERRLYFDSGTADRLLDWYDEGGRIKARK